MKRNMYIKKEGSLDLINNKRIICGEWDDRNFLYYWIKEFEQMNLVFEENLHLGYEVLPNTLAFYCWHAV